VHFVVYSVLNSIWYFDLSIAAKIHKADLHPFICFKVDDCQKKNVQDQIGKIRGIPVYYDR